MKQLIALFMIVTACFLVSGCKTSEGAIHKWQSRVNDWIRVGMSTDDVRKVMSQHGFSCTEPALNGMSCYKDTGFNRIGVSLAIVDGKVAYPPVTDVTRSIDF
jgi:hypothetical protein